ncbi:hypothetical protein ADA01nite_41000 [Aneurinibacillus danicus]|uniref:Uncharacterized protein n=1 Tax=Aneurinibacillus danicus TaxID=267746 RepID=A0A511VCL7_9BACL|nr:hypothetical protein ADA01nite_41000 [Aneurinibacillus danicus]
MINSVCKSIVGRREINGNRVKNLNMNMEVKENAQKVGKSAVYFITDIPDISF